MKRLFTKIFSLVCALIFFAAGTIIFRLYRGYVPSGKDLNIYYQWMKNPSFSDILLGASITFGVFGFIFLIIFLRKKQPVLDAVTIEKEGEVIRIPVPAIQDVVQQILSLNPHFSETDIEIHKDKKWILIDIFCSYKGNRSIPNQTSEVKEIIKGEIRRVFDFPYLRINFQLDKITLEHDDNNAAGEEGNSPVYPAGSEFSGEEITATSSETNTADGEETEVADETGKNEAVLKEKPVFAHKKMPWEN